jgi:hypothetical protein
MSAGSTEYGKEGGLVMDDNTSLTCGRDRFDVLVDTALAEPRLPLREDMCSRVLVKDEEKDRNGCGDTDDDVTAIVLCVTVVVVVIIGESVEWNARVVVVVVTASMRQQTHHVVRTRRRWRSRSLCIRAIFLDIVL